MLYVNEQTYFIPSAAIAHENVNASSFRLAYLSDAEKCPEVMSTFNRTCSRPLVRRGIALARSCCANLAGSQYCTRGLRKHENMPNSDNCEAHYKTYSCSPASSSTGGYSTFCTLFMGLYDFMYSKNACRAKSSGRTRHCNGVTC